MRVGYFLSIDQILFPYKQKNRFIFSFLGLYGKTIHLLSILTFILPENIKCQSVANCHHHCRQSKNIPAFFVFLALDPSNDDKKNPKNCYQYVFTHVNEIPKYLYHQVLAYFFSLLHSSFSLKSCGDYRLYSIYQS